MFHYYWQIAKLWRISPQWCKRPPCYISCRPQLGLFYQASLWTRCQWVALTKTAISLLYVKTYVSNLQVFNLKHKSWWPWLYFLQEVFQILVCVTVKSVMIDDCIFYETWACECRVYIFPRNLHCNISRVLRLRVRMINWDSSQEIWIGLWFCQVDNKTEICRGRIKL